MDRESFGLGRNCDIATVLCVSSDEDAILSDLQSVADNICEHLKLFPSINDQPLLVLTYDRNMHRLLLHAQVSPTAETHASDLLLSAFDLDDSFVGLQTVAQGSINMHGTQSYQNMIETSIAAFDTVCSSL